MGRKTIRMLMCAAFAATLGTFGTAARAVEYSLPFDPPFTFMGVVDLDIPSTCLMPSNSTHDCGITFISASFSDAEGRNWTSGASAFQTDMIKIDDGGQFVALAATLTFPFLLFNGPGEINPCNRDGATQQLTFTLGNTVSFSCNGLVSAGDMGTYRVVPAGAVPEPATLALLGLGLAGLAASRRRKLH